MNERYEVIIIGSGAGGAAAAYRLAKTGKRILVLEKGRTVPTDGSTLDVDQVFRQAAFKTKEPWRDGWGRIFRAEEYFNLGGKTKWHGAALIRFRPHEFEADPGHRCRAWPIRYEDLEPYYLEAESLLKVRSFEIEPDLRRILNGLRRRALAWQEHVLPLGLAPDILDHPEEAKHFDGFASAKALKADAEVCLLDRLEGANHVDILTGKEVTALEPVPDHPQRIGAVMCADSSHYECETVLLAAGALHSPRLLERYMQYTGLAARSAAFAQIGRNHKCHLNSAVLAVFRNRKTDLLRKTALLFHPAFPHSSVQTLGWMDGEIVGAQLPGLVPRIVADAIGARAYGFWLCTEDGSSPDNRVIDANGVAYPTLDYDLDRLPEALREHRRLWHTLRRQLLTLGHIGFIKPISIQGTAHACGTLAAGHDTVTSVIDANGRAHDLDNLYVVDGSALPRSSRVNPALTIYAWGLRVADRLANRKGE